MYNTIQKWRKIPKWQEIHLGVGTIRKQFSHICGWSNIGRFLPRSFRYLRIHVTKRTGSLRRTLLLGLGDLSRKHSQFSRSRKGVPEGHPNVDPILHSFPHPYRRAEPFEKLQKRFKEFESRMARKILMAKQMEDEDPDLDTTHRPPLQRLTRRQATMSVREGISGPNVSRISLSKNCCKQADGVAQASSCPPLGSKAVASQGNGFHIFQGQEEESDDKSGTWSVLAPEKERRKENQPLVTTWNKPLKVESTE